MLASSNERVQHLVNDVFEAQMKKVKRSEISDKVTITMGTKSGGKKHHKVKPTVTIPKDKLFDPYEYLHFTTNLYLDHTQSWLTAESPWVLDVNAF